MSNVVIGFEGMSLIASSDSRSEAFFISTDKVKTQPPHFHKHRLMIAGIETPVSDAVVWLEDNNRNRLTGKVDPTGQLFLAARLDDISPGDQIAQALATDNPEGDRAWLDLLDIWFRLPGGALETLPTQTIGGTLTWNFQAPSGALARKLTQTGTLRLGVTVDRIRVAIKSRTSNVEYHNVQPDARGDFRIDVMTEFDPSHTPGPMPTPGSTVQLSEMQLLYACLKSGSGPIPYAIWPSNPQSGAAALKKTSDPVTGICPFGFKRPL
jgi:hypothetical protein